MIMLGENLKKKIRELAFDLAYEEESGTQLKNNHERNREHDYLLKKLYKIKKRRS